MPRKNRKADESEEEEEPPKKKTRSKKKTTKTKSTPTKQKKDKEEKEEKEDKEEKKEKKKEKPKPKESIFTSKAEKDKAIAVGKKQLESLFKNNPKAPPKATSAKIAQLVKNFESTYKGTDVEKWMTAKSQEEFEKYPFPPGFTALRQE